MNQPPTPSSARGPESEPVSSRGLVPVQARPRPHSVLADRWEIVGTLGDGGTAIVYRAHDRQEDKFVAIKVLHPELARDRTMRERFRRESYAANQVQHPAVVKILADGALEDQTPFLVMEYLEGETLERRLERKGGRLPATEVLWAMDKVLDVLASAHSKGIVHRDLKPENLFLTEDRRIKVLDFGLARLQQGSSQLTQIGLVMGTPSFMPPEQARGAWAEVDVQTDLWAVGATMFYLLSGRLVHEGTKIQEVVQAATNRVTLSLRDVAPHLPEAIVDLVDFALAFEMSRRWRSARLMQHALRKAHQQLRYGDSTPDSDAEESHEVPPLNLDDAPEPPPTSLRSEQLTAGLPVPLIVDRIANEQMDTLPSARSEELPVASPEPAAPDGPAPAPEPASEPTASSPPPELSSSAAPAPRSLLVPGLSVVALALLGVLWLLFRR